MNYLLDSHTLIWAIIDQQKLPSKICAVLENPDNTILVSAVNFWEIALKYALGKLDLDGVLPQDFPELAEQAGFELLSLMPGESATFYLLNASWHRDPFDRMLIWQALKGEYIFISNDKQVRKYKSIGLKVLW